MSNFFHRAYFTLNPQGTVVTPRAHGLDISKYDLYFRPQDATGQLDFVVQRISYGTTRDEAFLSLVDGVMQVPIRGGYHYLSSWLDWRRQADKYIEYTKDYEYHFHNADFEDAFNTMSFDFAQNTWNWIHYVQDKTGKPTLLYTSPSLYNDWIRKTQGHNGIDWNTIDLWTAQWFFVPNPNGTPTMPIGRTRGWKVWQYTDKADGTKYGVARPTACDLDVFNGSVSQMKEWLGITTVPNPQPGVPMYLRVVSSASNIRSSAGVQTNPDNDLGPDNLLQNDIVEVGNDTVSISGTVWRRILRWWRGQTERQLPTSPTNQHWAAERGSTFFYMIATEFTPPVPPTPSNDYLLHYASDGTFLGKYVKTNE